MQEQYGWGHIQSGNRQRSAVAIACHPEAAPAVHVIDDDDSFRASMIRLLNASSIAAIGYACAGEFLLAQQHQPSGCILLDITMPGPSGIELLKALVARGSAPPIVFVTGRDDVLTSVDVMKAGAFDYIVKPVVAERVLHVVRRALEVDAKRGAARHELAELKARFESLTPIERTIFFGVISNRLNKQIAADLGTCERTIKAQRSRMMTKLDVGTVPELVRAAKLLEGPHPPSVARPVSSATRHPSFGIPRRL